MGIVWETDPKEVPVLWVPGITLEAHVGTAEAVFIGKTAGYPLMEII